MTCQSEFRPGATVRHSGAYNWTCPVCSLVVDGPGNCALGLGLGEHEGYLGHLRFSNSHFHPLVALQDMLPWF